MPANSPGTFRDALVVQVAVGHEHAVVGLCHAGVVVTTQPADPSEPVDPNGSPARSCDASRGTTDSTLTPSSAWLGTGLPGGVGAVLSIRGLSWHRRDPRGG